MTPPEPRGGERLTSTERLHDVIGKLRQHIVLIQDAKARVDAGESITRDNPIIACVNDLPTIVRELDMAELEIEADFEAHEDRPTAPSASGGEPFGWMIANKRDGHTWFSRDHGNVETWRADPDFFTVTEVFAHPARMPTRDEIEDALYGMNGDWRTKASEAVADAILALFHTGETKGDGRG